MNITELKGRQFPQRVVLDCNIVTVTGELFPIGSEIVVLLCDNLIRCSNSQDYCNVTEETRSESQQTDKFYMNPATDEQFLDFHCNGEKYENVNDLCRDYPRYFSCEKDFFTVDENECAVRVEAGQTFEIKKVEKIKVPSLDAEQNGTLYTNVTVPESKRCNVIHCFCKETGDNFQLSSNINSKFRAIEDKTHYKVRELLFMFPLPRQVLIFDDEFQAQVLPFIYSKEVTLEEVNSKCSLLFIPASDYNISEQSGIEVKHRVKCCEFNSPEIVSIRQRIDNSQIGEQFDTVFVHEKRLDIRLVFTLIGRKRYTAKTRVRSGRQQYIAMGIPVTHTTGKVIGETKQDSGYLSGKHSAFDTNLEEIDMRDGNPKTCSQDMSDDDYIVPCSEQRVDVCFEAETPFYGKGKNKDNEIDEDAPAKSNTDQGNQLPLSGKSIPKTQKNNSVKKQRIKTPPSSESDTQIVVEKEQNMASDQGSEMEKKVIVASDQGSETEKKVIVASDQGSEMEKKVIVASDQGSETETKVIVASDQESETEKKVIVASDQGSETEKKVIVASEQGSKTVKESKEPSKSLSPVTEQTAVPPGEQKPQLPTASSQITGGDTGIRDMTCDQLATLLKSCKLNKFAAKCEEEGVDGDLFLELTDDMLEDEPFCLKKFDILKVNRLKTGWKPK